MLILRPPLLTWSPWTSCRSLDPAGLSHNPEPHWLTLTSQSATSVFSCPENAPGRRERMHRASIAAWRPPAPRQTATPTWGELDQGPPPPLPHWCSGRLTAHSCFVIFYVYSHGTQLWSTYCAQVTVPSTVEETKLNQAELNLPPMSFTTEQHVPGSETCACDFISHRNLKGTPQKYSKNQKVNQDFFLKDFFQMWTNFLSFYWICYNIVSAFLGGGGAARHVGS